MRRLAPISENSKNFYFLKLGSFLTRLSPYDNDLSTSFRVEVGFDLVNPLSRCYWIEITAPKGCSGISNL